MEDYEPLPQRIYLGQIIRDYFARLIGLIITGTQFHNLLRGAVLLLSVCMIVYPLKEFGYALSNGVLLVSLPLLLMFIAGLFGLRVNYHWGEML